MSQSVRELSGVGADAEVRKPEPPNPNQHPVSSDGVSTKAFASVPSMAEAVPLPETSREWIEYLRSVFCNIPGADDALASLDHDDVNGSAGRDLALEARAALATLPAVKQIIGESRADFIQILDDVLRYVFKPDCRVRFSGSYNPHVFQLENGSGGKELALVRRILGVGGFGVVTEAFRNGVQTAIKTLALWRENAREMGNVASLIYLNRFIAEHTMLGMLYRCGFSVPEVTDSGYDRGYPYFSMRHIDGVDLGKLNCSMTDAENSGQRRPVKQLYLFLAGIAQSFADMHNPEGATGMAETAADYVEMSGNGNRAVAVLHRDIKPWNIMLGRDGGATVLDFGIAKEHDDGTPDRTALTQTGQIMGTPSHTAPEIIRLGSIHASRASDAYSFGCCLYHMITGKPPFGGTLFDIQRGHAEEFPDFDLIPDMEVRAIIMRLMNKRPENRGPKGVRDAPLSDVSGVLHQAFMRLATAEELSRYEGFLALPPRERKVPELVSLLPPGSLEFGGDAGEPDETAKLSTAATPINSVHRPTEYVVGKNGQPIRMNFRRRVLRRLNESRAVKVIATAIGVSMALATAMLSYLLFVANKSSPAHGGNQGNALVTPEAPETAQEPNTQIEFTFNSQGDIHDIHSITVVIEGKEVTIHQKEIYRVFNGEESSSDVRAFLFEHPGDGNPGSSPFLSDGFVNRKGNAVFLSSKGYTCVSPGKGVVLNQNDGNDEFAAFVEQIRNLVKKDVEINGLKQTVPFTDIRLINASEVPPSVQELLPDGDDAFTTVEKLWLHLQEIAARSGNAS